ncbi:MAG: aspartate/glutamate racemase family protein [Nitrososphaerota archaeon]
MRIKIINPNTTESMTEAIREKALRYARPGTEIVALNPSIGPVSIESYYDEALATIGVLEEVKRGEAEGFDGYAIACYGDPGLYAAREVARSPVVGIGETSMLMACTLGYKFSIITILDRFIGPVDEMVKRYGLTERCASIRVINTPVLDIEKGGEKITRLMIEEGRKAVTEDRAEVLLLGCAGMAGLEESMEEALGVPVIDGIVTAVKMLEGLADYGKKTSKIHTFRYPEKKVVRGFTTLHGLTH